MIATLQALRPETVRQNETGQSLVLFALLMSVFLLMLGVVIDLGHAMARQRQMQVAADAAALAGAYELALGSDSTVVSDRVDQVLSENGADPDLSTYVVTDTTVHVTARQDVPTFFGGSIGLDTIPVQAEAEAGFGELTQTGGLMPFVVEKDLWGPGQPVILWDGKNGPGNFGWVRWAGQTPSTTVLRYNLDHPEDSDVVSIGDYVNGHTGVSFGAVLSNLQAWIGKEVTVILYDPAEITGSGSGLKYRVAGFARFEVTAVYSLGSNSEIHGVFRSYVKLGGTPGPVGLGSAKAIGFTK